MRLISKASLLLIFISILVVFFVKKYNNYIHNNKEYLRKLIIKNIYIYICLFIITMLIFIFYRIFIKEEHLNKILNETLMGIFILLFSNIFGYILAIINIKRIYLIIISHGIFIGSTFLVSKLIDYFINILIEKRIISGYSITVFFDIIGLIGIMIIENIISYYILKIYIIKNRKISIDVIS
jgi:hypothetical protein